MLTRATFRGPWAGLPVAWTAADTFAEAVYREDVARCCRAGVPGVYTAGTTGEFYAMDWEEWEAVSRATVETCRSHGTPCMLGCTSTYTRGAQRRAALAARLGAAAVQVALPFWMEVPDDQVVPFFQAVAAAAEGLPLSVYETTRTRKTLTVDQHRRLKDAVPQYLMVKANANTVGATAAGCRALAEVVNVFVGEHRWAELCPCGAAGSCSSLVYWNPRVILGLWASAAAQDWAALRAGCARLEALDAFLGERYEPAGFTDTAYDRMGGRAFGFLESSLHNRGPYVSPTQQDVEDLRAWCRAHFPEMLAL